MNYKQLIDAVEVKLKDVYKDSYEVSFLTKIEELIATWEKKEFTKTPAVSEKNVYLITYGDSIYEEGQKTLPTLQKFLNTYGDGSITDVHLLPMFEYTSDDGFSVVDYMKIDENLGDWNNINDLAKDYRLMFDFVANHMSKSSDWFKGYLNGDDTYANYFIPQDDSFDASNVVRPRTSPLFHEYEGKNGVKTAWSTFSEDQVDLNVKHFPVYVEMTNILLEYAYNGATSIRLDAIGFMWKESGTSCIHLTETHELIKVWRLILDYFKYNTQIITETNVPHKENISYFGKGHDEAHMVYQFSLPPLTLYTMTTHNAKKLTEWSKSIDKVSDTATYFNFLSSHDGIGMRPTEGILNDDERQLLVDKVVKNGGRVSYKNNTDGTKSVYELNINYNDALLNGDEDVTEAMQVKKILGAHSILLSCVGVPAIYYHSLLGSRNDYEGLENSGINRRINREKLEYSKLVDELANDSRRQSIFSGMKSLIATRKQESAFSPYAKQTTLDLGEELFALERHNEETNEKITFILNVTTKPVTINTNLTGLDLVTNQQVNNEITLQPYEFVWVK